MIKLSTILFLIFYIIDENFGENNPIETGNVVVTRSKEGYTYSFQTKDIDRFEVATFLDTDKSDEINLNVFGFYSFTGSDGRLYSVRYQANDKGYHPIVTIGTKLDELLEPPSVIVIGTAAIKTLTGNGLG